MIQFTQSIRTKLVWTILFLLLAPVMSWAAEGSDDAYAFDDTMLEEALVYPDWFKLSLGDLSDDLEEAKKAGIELKLELLDPSSSYKKEMEKIALQLDFVQKWTEGKTIRKVIIVPGRMVNIVVS